jgi:hypothetical protein
LVDAERAVRTGYLLQALGNAEDIQVSDEEVDQEIRKWVEQSKTKETFESVKASIEKSGGTAEIRGRVRTDKIFDMLLKSATVTEELLDKKAYEELLELERRREEGIAQARFDAGGLEGGDLAEQEGGEPEAVVPAGEESHNAHDAHDAHNAHDAHDEEAKPIEEAHPKRGRKKAAEADEEETESPEEPPVAKRAKKAEPEPEPDEPEEKPKRGRPKKAEAEPEPEPEEKPKRGRPKKADAES